jgi:apolipoprotein N-acyltransferase
MANLFLAMLSCILFFASQFDRLLFFCFVPAFLLLFYLIEKERSLLRLVLYAALIGTGAHAGAFFWVWTVYPIHWLGDAPMLLQFLGIFVYWAISSFVMGLGTVAFAAALRFFLRIPGWAVLLLTPLLWVGSELFRSFLFSVYQIAPGMTFNLDMGMGYVGNVLAVSPVLRQTAAFGGVYVLSYIAVFLALLIYLPLRSRRFYAAGIAVLTGAILLFIPFPYAIHSAPAIHRSVIAVTTKFDHSITLNGDVLRKETENLKQAIALAIRLDPDAVVLPEDGGLTGLFNSSDEVFAFINEANPLFQGVIVDSHAVEDEEGRFVLRAFIYDMKNETVYHYDKTYLVPLGEYIPSFYRGLLSLFLSDDAMRSVSQSVRLQPGLPQGTPDAPAEVPKVLFCFEDLKPYGVRTAPGSSAATFVAHPISHAWFTRPYTLWYQIDAIVSIQSIWSGLPVVSAGNMTASKLYLPDGSIEEGDTLQRADLWSLERFTF